MTLAKYFGTNEDGHNGQLMWPGTVDGFPMRIAGGAQPLLTEQELQEVPLVFDAKVRVFDLSKPEDHRDYEHVIDRHANGWYQITKRDSRYDDDTKNWRIYLEWVQIYGEVPKDKAAHF